MKRSFHIGIACACGAGIGTLVALSVGPMLWWLGTLAGALCGYLMIDFREIPKKIKIAWLSTFTWWGDARHWHLIGLYISLFVVVFSWLGIVALSMVLMPTRNEMSLSALLSICFGFSGLVGFVASLLQIDIFLNRFTFGSSEKWYIYFFRTNPATVYGYFIPRRVLKYCRRSLLKHVMQFIAFLKKAILAIHSDIRLLCAVDAALGTCVGYFLGHVFYGVAFGFLFGFVNYEIISKRVLKCVNVRS